MIRKQYILYTSKVVNTKTIKFNYVKNNCDLLLYTHIVSSFGIGRGDTGKKIRMVYLVMINEKYLKRERASEFVNR